MRRLLCLLAALLFACSPDAQEPLSIVRQAVTAGQTATPCQWPSVVMVQLSAGVCSGTLVHPRLVTLASHCQLVGTVRSILFGETGAMPARTVLVDSCKFHPGFQPDVDDVAYCVLKEAVTDVPIAPALMGCETDVLTRGRMVDMVGFGLSSLQARGTIGVKRWAELPIENMPGPTTSFVSVGRGMTGACEGDSGGPLLVRLDDGTWRTIGTASTTTIDPVARQCTPPTDYMRLDRYVGWIEQNSGIDITPCHDADGRWNPGPDCGRFSTSADHTTGTWATSCNGPGAVSAGPSLTCAGDGGASPIPGAPEAGAAPEAGVNPPASPPEPPPAPSGSPDAAPAPPQVQPTVGPADAAPDVGGPARAPAAAGRGGCACSVHPAPAGFWWLIGAALIMAGRRRRRGQRRARENTFPRPPS